MTELLLQTGALVSSVALAATTLDPLEQGERLGHMTAASVLGVVCLACVAALVFVYRDKAKDVEKSRIAHDEHTDRLYKLIEANTTATQSYADKAEEQTQAIREMKDVVVACQFGIGIRVAAKDKK